MKILKIAVTGSAGSGKSLVCQRFGQIGLGTLDCDRIARQVVEPGTPGFDRIVELFGTGVVGTDGSLDRAGLRTIIMNDPGLRKKMENILHPLIKIKMLDQMEFEGGRSLKKAVAVEVPLLFETGMETLFDVCIVVTADDPDLVKRIVGRDRVTRVDAQKMLDLQMSQQEKMDRADHVIINRGTSSELFDSVDDLFDKIQKEFLTI
jgi:dephospho-CoA kinase